MESDIIKGTRNHFTVRMESWYRTVVDNGWTSTIDDSLSYKVQVTREESPVLEKFIALLTRHVDADISAELIRSLYKSAKSESLKQSFEASPDPPSNKPPSPREDDGDKDVDLEEEEEEKEESALPPPPSRRPPNRRPHNHQGSALGDRMFLQGECNGDLLTMASRLATAPSDSGSRELQQGFFPNQDSRRPAASASAGSQAAAPGDAGSRRSNNTTAGGAAASNTTTKSRRSTAAADTERLRNDTTTKSRKAGRRSNAAADTERLRNDANDTTTKSRKAGRRSNAAADTERLRNDANDTNTKSRGAGRRSTAAADTERLRNDANDTTTKSRRRQQQGTTSRSRSAPPVPPSRIINLLTDMDDVPVPPEPEPEWWEKNIPEKSFWDNPTLPDGQSFVRINNQGKMEIKSTPFFYLLAEGMVNKAAVKRSTWFEDVVPNTEDWFGTFKTNGEKRPNPKLPPVTDYDEDRDILIDNSNGNKGTKSTVATGGQRRRAQMVKDSLDAFMEYGMSFVVNEKGRLVLNLNVDLQKMQQIVTMIMYYSQYFFPKDEEFIDDTTHDKKNYLRSRAVKRMKGEKVAGQRNRPIVEGYFEMGYLDYSTTIYDTLVNAAEAKMEKDIEEKWRQAWDDEFEEVVNEEGEPDEEEWKWSEEYVEKLHGLKAQKPEMIARLDKMYPRNYKTGKAAEAAKLRKAEEESSKPTKGKSSKVTKKKSSSSSGNSEVTKRKSRSSSGNNKKKKAKDEPKYNIGDKVEVRVHVKKKGKKEYDEKWYNGTIHEVYDNFTYDINFDDGDFGEFVNERDVLPFPNYSDDEGDSEDDNYVQKEDISENDSEDDNDNSGSEDDDLDESTKVEYNERY